MPNIPHFKDWIIERSGAGLRVKGKRYNEYNELVFNNDKITSLAYVGKSLSGELAGFNKAGLVVVYLDL